MAARRFIVIDQPPLPRTRWAGEALREAGYVEAEQSRIDEAMKNDPESARMLRETFLQPDAPQRLAPYYWRAFESLYGQAPQVGVYGTAWLVFAPAVDACVIDWTGLGLVEPDAVRGLSADALLQARDAQIDLGRAFVRERAGVLPRERVLELPDGLDDAARVARSLEFLRGLGLA